MDNTGHLLWIILAVPVAFAGICRIFRSPRSILSFMCAGVFAETALVLAAAGYTFYNGTLSSIGQWFYIDSLSAFHLLVMMLVFCMSTVYGCHYFDEKIDEGVFTTRLARRYASLWFASLAAMSLVLVSNNLGLMWVGMETTTLVTAFLICVYSNKTAVEAMWKYLIICSVGIAFAFMGTLLVAASAHTLEIQLGEALLWTKLVTVAGGLNPALVKAGFVFILVGYGTKAGLAPMHTWLPDAHSQAPAPVSAIFSGFMLNAALYCIMRYIPLVDQVSGASNFSRELLVLFGIGTIIISAAFILSQHDLKRLLAYHSVEHLGIITLGLGLGPAGIFAALFHTLNHSVCKSLGFFCAGRLGQIYGTYDMREISGSVHLAPLWGGGLMGSLIALIGVAPFALFMSEFLIVKAALETNTIWAMVLFLIGSSVVFIGALKHAIPIAWGESPAVHASSGQSTFFEKGLVTGALALLLVLGVWMPDMLSEMLSRAADIVGGQN
ncbi:MAG: proton-conducting transporter membrane subunit [Desulfobacterales bacterium]|nr:proton-conducting transporter membrane subunit [Desulfobacterales bacterium]MDD4393814.1 proton-conducting transporter membrane subunit [Desulfobacterales bacterium]